jgi:probable phosphoglycerate mutase
VTRFLLVRHGQSEWNAQGRWQGQGDPHLSDRGREEAKLAASVLRDFDGIVFSSPLLRALETAELIASLIGRGQVFVENDLSEIDVGDFSGLTNEQIEEQLPDDWRALREGRLEMFPGGEARDAFLQRVLAALERMAARHPDPDAELLVVTHGGAISAVERHLGVHPGVGVANLEGRWFEVGSQLSACGDRIALADQPG